MSKPRSAPHPLHQSTRDAIDRHLPLFLSIKDGAIELSAQTSQFENGNIRSRKLYRGNFAMVYWYCKQVFEYGGAVNVDFHIGDYNIWELGWKPELSSLRDDLKRRWQARPAKQQPQW